MQRGDVMIDYFFQLNIKILLVLLLFGYVMGLTRQAVWRNIRKNNRGTLFLELLNLTGVPVHELSHLFFALLFGYHIDDICLYRRIRTARKHGGTLGYVRMHFDKTGSLQSLRRDVGQFFIGIGPLLLPPALLFALGRLLPASLRSLPAAFQRGPEYFFKVLQQLDGADIIILFVYLYVMISVSLNMELSRQDLHMAVKGLLALELIFFILSVVFFLTGWQPDAFLNILFRWNLLTASTGVICGLMFHLISLLKP